MLRRTFTLLHYFSSRINLSPTTCYYKTLNIPTYASVNQIRMAYLDLVKKFHPDINKEPDASQKFTEIQRAYEVLSEELTRKEYDEANKIGSRPEDKPQETVKSQEELLRDREFFREKYIRGEDNKRKDELNDELNFSYKMYKKHFERVEVPKDDYIKYPGTDQEYYEKKDDLPDPVWKRLIFMAIPVVLLGGVWWGIMTHKKPSLMKQKNTV